MCFPGSSSQPRFIQTHKDLHLTVTEEIDLGKNVFYWEFKRNIIIMSYKGELTIAKHYKDRVDFLQDDLSLILKNVTLSDSGIYTAQVYQDGDVTLSEYNVTVQGEFKHKHRFKETFFTSC